MHPDVAPFLHLKSFKFIVQGERHKEILKVSSWMLECYISEIYMLKKKIWKNEKK